MLLDFNKDPKGIAPAINPIKLAENVATIAENVTFEDGRIVPIKDNSLETTVASGTQEIYKWKYEEFYCRFTGTLSGDITLSIDDVEYTFSSVGDIQANLRAETGRFEIYTTGEFLCYGFVSDFSCTGASDITYENGVDHSIWLDYDEKKDIVTSPIVNDQYARLYMTDSSGDLQIKGLMGERDLKMPLPSDVGDISSLAATNLFDWSFPKLFWYGGGVSNAVDCQTPINIELVDDGAVLTYRFPGFSNTTRGPYCSGGPTLRINYEASNYLPATAMCGTNIVSETPPVLSHDGNDYGVFDVVSATGDYMNYTEGTVYTQTIPGIYLYEDIDDTETTLTLAGDPNYAGSKYITINDEIILLGTRGTLQTSPDRYEYTGCTRARYSSVAAEHTTEDVVAGLNLRTYDPCDIVVTIDLRAGFSREQVFYYLYTYLDDIGQESPPSGVSELAVRKCGELITVTLPNVSSPGNMKYRRLYRSATTGTGGGWSKVADIPINTDVYEDYIPDRALGISLGPYGNPVKGMDFLVVHPCGSLIGARGRTIYATAPFLPYAWVSSYTWTVSSDITGLVIQGNDIIILTKGHPNILTGSLPTNFAREELNINQSCLSRHSICKIGQSVFYASPDGYVQIQNGQAVVITDGIFDKEYWESINPENIIAETYDKKLFAFTDVLAFQYDKGNVSTFSDSIINLFRDDETDILYILQDVNINKLQKDSTNLVTTWQSKEFLVQKPITFSVAQIKVEDYSNVYLKIYANSVLVLTYQVVSELAFRLPIMRPETLWQFRIETQSPVDEFQIGTNMNELRN
jgi:hypothetical protein